MPGYHFFISGCRAPPLAAIGPSHVPDVRFAVPLAATCGTLQPLTFVFSFAALSSVFPVYRG
ncbi:MAG: hypothetical protein CVU68_12595 [Deltaproteobacteria bacterium HGW-Deltaproteobacteria-3]|nr:MAG: hypothetical protein CVU68_12595 [Deltaproteobacteria bacterium HGW-Deltaproteobacteria-3]